MCDGKFSVEVVVMLPLHVSREVVAEDDGVGFKDDANGIVNSGPSGNLAGNVGDMSATCRRHVGDKAKCRLFSSRQANFGDMVFSVSAHFCVAVSRY